MARTQKSGKKTPQPAQTKEDQEELQKSEPPAKQPKLSTSKNQTKEETKQEDEQLPVGDGVISQDQILITTWNIKGLVDAAIREKLQNYLENAPVTPDIICFSDTRINTNRVDPAEFSKEHLPDYDVVFHNATKKYGLAGTAIATKFPPISYRMGLGDSKLDDQEGRVITAEFEKFFLVCAYAPSAGAPRLKNLDYKVKEWDPAFRDYIAKLKKEKEHVIICGNLNVAHENIDVYDPESHENSPGFTKEEKESFEELLKMDFVDVFRHLNPDKQQFTAWDRALKLWNHGWRVDYFLIDKGAVNAVGEIKTLDEQVQSGHCPIEMTLDPNFNAVTE